MLHTLLGKKRRASVGHLHEPCHQRSGTLEAGVYLTDRAPETHIVVMPQVYFINYYSHYS